MFGRDGAVRSQEAVFDVGEHGICPAEGGVSGGGTIGAGDVALVADARLPRNAAKPLPAVADDGGSGLDTGAEPLGFGGLEPADNLQGGLKSPPTRGLFDRYEKGGVAAPPAP